MEERRIVSQADVDRARRKIFDRLEASLAAGRPTDEIENLTRAYRNLTPVR